MKDIICDHIFKNYDLRIFNSTYHDLQPSNLIANSRNLGPLFSLGLNFCVQPDKPSSSDIDIKISRRKLNVKLKYTFVYKLRLEETTKQIYVKSKWNPDPGSTQLETTIDLFETKLISSRNNVLQRK